MRRVVLLMVAALVTMLSLTACAGKTGEPALPGSPGVTTSAPTLIAVPDVVGKNAAVAVDTLEKAGFTNIDLGTVDGRPLVILPQNWTVKTQSAKPGDLLRPDAKIVLGCARNE